MHAPSGSSFLHPKHKNKNLFGHCTQRKQVEGWQVPSVLVERASVAGHALRFSLSVSFYHAGSKRFYGDTFMGESLDEEDEERVEIVSEKRQRSSSTSRKVRGTECSGYT